MLQAAVGGPGTRLGCSDTLNDVILLRFRAEMSNHQIFRRHFPNIQTTIRSTIDDVASKCFAKLIVPKALRVRLVGDDAQKAKVLVDAVLDQIEVDESNFDKFVEILSEEPAFKGLVDDLKREFNQMRLEAVDSGSERDHQNFGEKDRRSKPNPDQAWKDSGIQINFSTSSVEFDSEMPSASPEMPKLELNEEVHVQSRFQIGTPSTEEGECCKSKLHTDHPFPSPPFDYQSDRPTEYVKTFQHNEGGVPTPESSEVVRQETYSSNSELVGHASLSLTANGTGEKSESYHELIGAGLRKAHEEMRQKDTKIKCLESEIEAKNRAESKLKLLLEEMRQENRRIECEKKEEIEDLKNQVEKYKKQLSQKEKETQKMKEQYESSMEQLKTQSEQSMRNYQAEIRELIENAQKEKEKKEVELANLRTKLAEKEADFREKLLENEKEAGKLREKLAATEMSKAQVMIELEKAKRENAEMRATVAEERVQTVEAAHRQECEQKNARIQELCEEVSMLKTQISHDSTTG